MNTQPIPLQARLHLGEETIILTHHHDVTALQAKLLVQLDDSPDGTQGDIIDLLAKRIVFQARKVAING